MKFLLTRYFFFRGNLISVATTLGEMHCVVRLVSFMLNHQFFEMDCSNKISFMKCLRMAVRIAGCENRNVTLCIQVIIMMIKVGFKKKFFLLFPVIKKEKINFNRFGTVSKIKKYIF